MFDMREIQARVSAAKARDLMVRAREARSLHYATIADDMERDGEVEQSLIRSVRRQATAELALAMQIRATVKAS